MQARELIDLAAMITAHAQTLIEAPGNISPAGLEQYWAAERCRQQRWHETLTAFVRSPAELHAVAPATNHFRATLDEILASEVLTRVWATVLAAHDRRRQLKEAEPIGRSVYLAHVEARTRVLELMIGHAGLPLEDAVSLNQLRRRSERWTDVLIGQLLQRYDVAEFAVNADRAREFSTDLGADSSPAARRQAWGLMMVSLRTAFQAPSELCSPNTDLNQRVAGSILACFPHELFDSTGVFQSLWLTRMHNTSRDAEGMVEQLLKLDEPAGKPIRISHGPHRRVT